MTMNFSSVTNVLSEAGGAIQTGFSSLVENAKVYVPNVKNYAGHTYESIQLGNCAAAGVLIVGTVIVAEIFLKLSQDFITPHTSKSFRILFIISLFVIIPAVAGYLTASEFGLSLGLTAILAISITTNLLWLALVHG